MEFRSLFPLILAIALSLSSCVTPVVTQGNISRGAALTSPKRDAIVGMWHKRETGYEGSLVIVETMLLKPDGTGVHRFNRRGMIGGSGQNDENFNLTWRYDGGGWWTVVSQCPTSTVKKDFGWQTDGNVIFSTYKPSGRQLPIVWSRLAQ